MDSETVKFVLSEEMGSAEQEVIIENIQPLVPEDEVSTAVICDVSDHQEDKKNVENEGIVACASVASEFQ